MCNYYFFVIAALTTAFAVMTALRARGIQVALVAVAPRAWGNEILAVAELVPDADESATGHFAVSKAPSMSENQVGETPFSKPLKLWLK